MKRYKLVENQNGRFQEKHLQTVGFVEANSKGEAIEKFRKAYHGQVVECSIYPGLIGNWRNVKPEIEK